MKKGLLSLLAVALTVVGCQNYDDQFDELSDQITALSATVQGLSTVADQITALQNTVNGLELTLGGEISSIKTAVEALTASLDDVATAADLGIISSTLAEVQADVKELLAANAVINQNITINNVATLEYVESLISTDVDDPNVIVNGSIEVSVDDDDFDDEHLARILAVTNKFATSLGAVTITHTYSPTTVGPGPILTFDNLAFVDADLTVSGSNTLADGDVSNDKLRTVTGDLDIENIVGDLDLSLLTSANNITVPEAVTSLKMGSVKATSLKSAGKAAGELNLPKALVIDGGASKVATLTAAKATDIDITSAATLTVNAALAETIDIGGTALTGDLTVNGTSSGTTIVHLDDVKSVDGTISSGVLAELHLPALTSVATLSSAATVLALTKLATQKASTTITLTKATAFSAPLDVSATLSLTLAKTVSIKDISDGNVIMALAATDMTITGLAAKNSFVYTKAATVFPSLKNITVTGIAAAAGPFISEQTNQVSITSAIVESVNIVAGEKPSQIDIVNLDDMTKLKTLGTSGFIRNFVLDGGGTDFESASFLHDHIEGSDAALFSVTNCSKLKAVDAENLDEVGHITLSGLPAMTSMDFSAATTLPQLGLYTVTLNNTGLTGSYAIATEITTTTTVYKDKVYSDDLMTLKPYMDASTASGLVTFVFEGDLITSTTTKTYDADGNVAVTSTTTDTLANNISTYSNPSQVVTIVFKDSMFTQVVAE